MSTNEQRSSSAVRNLRSIFEKNGNDVDASPGAPRGRSSGSLDRGSRQTSTVRVSFVPVELPMASMDTDETMPQGKRGSVADIRRGSFSAGEAERESVAEDLKQSVTQEQERRDEHSSVSETIPEVAVETPPQTTPLVEAREDQAMGNVSHAASKLSAMTVADEFTARKQQGEPEHPDKPVTGAEDDDALMKPARPTDEDAVSGGEALPPATEDLRSRGQPVDTTPHTNGHGVAGHTEQQHAAEERSSVAQKVADANKRAGEKSTEMMTKVGEKLAPSSSKGPKSPPAKSPKSATSQSTSQSTSKSSPGLASKASRTSLTAPTAASLARAGREKSPPVPSATETKPKARGTTKLAELSSRLTAPTAASRARQEDANKQDSPKTNGKLPNKAATKPASARSTPRTSLATSQRPASRGSNASHNAAPKKSTAAPEGSFLDRMTRPTAASASRTHDKIEVKGSSHQQKSVGRPNGTEKHGIKHRSGAAGRKSDGHATGAATDNQPGETTDVTEQGLARPDGNYTTESSNVQPSSVLEATPTAIGESLR